MLAETRQKELRRYGHVLHAVGALVVLAILIVFYFAVHLPILSAGKQLDARVTANRERLEVAADTRNEHATLNDRLRESEELAKLVQRRIPQQPQTPQFLGSITEMAEDEDMTIRDFAVGDIFLRETHQEVSVQFSTAGDYASICRFLHRLRTMTRVVTFQQLTLDGETEAGVHQIQLALLLPFGITPEPALEASADG